MPASLDMMQILTEWDPSAKQDQLVQLFRDHHGVASEHILVVTENEVRLHKESSAHPHIAEIRAQGQIPVLFVAGEKKLFRGLRNHVYNADLGLEEFDRSLARVAQLQRSGPDRA